MGNFGGINVEEQKGNYKMPQKAASAWGEIDAMTGAAYKPITYVGTQQVKGINHVFIAEQTLILAEPERHIVIVKINEFNGAFNVVSIDQII
ncbi:MAG: hypothetical protein IJ728_14420 [Selenomonadaceae bacterium]|nr:hypothetical protein [Selenomonadaceae bacterium]MBR1730707.1 hypothetical protein [Selenomonadaceae bacterium]